MGNTFLPTFYIAYSGGQKSLPTAVTKQIIA